MFDQLVNAIASWMTYMATGIAEGETIHGLTNFVNYMYVYERNCQLVEDALVVIGIVLVAAIAMFIGIQLDKRSQKNSLPEYVDL